MEALDSALFALEDLVDYRATLNGGLLLDARTRKPGLEAQIKALAESCCPGISAEVKTESCSLSHRPMYLGKRHVIEY